MLIFCDILWLDLFNNKCIFGDVNKCGYSLNEFFKVDEVEKLFVI